MAKPDNNPDLKDLDDDVEDQHEDRDDADDLDDDLDHSDEGDEDEAEDDAEDGDDEPLGEKGTKALERMKRERRDLKRSLRELRKELDDLRNADDEDADELTTARKQTETERNKRLDAERRLAARVAGLPDSWAKRLEGEDYDDFLEDAEALAEDLPATPRQRKGGGGAKDGSRKRRREPSLDDKIAEAEKEGDLALARRLKAQKVHDLNKAS